MMLNSTFIRRHPCRIFCVICMKTALNATKNIVKSQRDREKMKRNVEIPLEYSRKCIVLILK